MDNYQQTVKRLQNTLNHTQKEHADDCPSQSAIDRAQSWLEQLQVVLNADFPLGCAVADSSGITLVWKRYKRRPTGEVRLFFPSDTEDEDFFIYSRVATKSEWINDPLMEQVADSLRNVIIGEAI